MSKNQEPDAKLPEDLGEAPESGEGFLDASDAEKDHAVSAANTEETATEESPDAQETEPADENGTEDGEAPDPAPAEAAESEEASLTDGKAAKKRRKGPFIQVPVIISLVIVVLAVIGYLVYSFFFLHVPEGVIWTGEYDGATYYFEFGEDGILTSTVGTIELKGTYKKNYADNQNTMTFTYNIGDFVAGMEAGYTITGAPILKNQEITFNYLDEDYTFTLKQVKEKDSPLELPDDFTPDQALLGDWVFSYNGTEYDLTFNEDGSMQMKFITGTGENQYIEIDRGTYSVDNGSISFTYFISEPTVRMYEYQIDGDLLTYSGMPFYRVKPATPDEG